MIKHPYIKLYGGYMGKSAYHIKRMELKAMRDNTAPANVVWYDETRKRWRTTDEFRSAHARKMLGLEVKQ